MKTLKNVPIVIDFDGTIVMHEYPSIGKPVPMALETMKGWQQEGALLILFTMRSGKELHEAVNYCALNGITFFGINHNPTQTTWTKSPKAYGEMYIDDAAVGCPLIYPENERPYVDWVKVKELVKKRVQ